MRPIARAVVAAGVVLLLAGCDSTSDDPDREPDGEPEPSATSASESTDPGPVVECLGTVVKERDPALPDAVPEGATSVRLCDGGAEKVPAPVDALTTDVAAVVDAVNGQRLVRGGCVDLRIPEYQLAFGYPDGSSFVVAGRFTGCAELLVGSARRARAMPPLHAFVEQLQAQRATQDPPAAVDPETLACDQPPVLWTGELSRPTALEVAVLCVGRPGDEADARSVVIPAEKLAVLVDSMRTSTSSVEGEIGCGVFPPRDHWIVGATAWGDPVAMRRGCLDLVIEGTTEWWPRGEARQILRDLTARAG